MARKLPVAPNYKDKDELTVAPLTAAERKWVEDAAKLFAVMPERLQLMESANSVSVVDAEGAKRSECSYGAASKDGIVLADLPSAMFKIFGVAA